MNNLDAKQLLDDCSSDLQFLFSVIIGIGQTSNLVPYLTKYAIIKACGTIETAFKGIIADFCSRRAKRQIKRYLDLNVRECSCNPSYSNICDMLNTFDILWKQQFKMNAKQHPKNAQLRTSLQSLIDARNEFAHGGNPTLSIHDVMTYFEDSRVLMEILDQVVC